PELERSRVVGSDLVQPDHREVGLAGGGALDHLERGEAAAGEDQGVCEAARGFLRLVEPIVDQNRLQEEEPVPLEQLGAAAEEQPAPLEKGGAAGEEQVEVLQTAPLDHLE